MAYSPGISVRIYGEGLDQTTKDFLNVSSAKTRRRAMMVGSAHALDAIKKYYSKAGRFLWLKKWGPTHGPGRKPTQWWRGPANGWSQMAPTSKKAEFINKAIGFAHKVTGGKITPKRKKMLTIPVTPQAHGLTARTFSKTIAPLFRVKNALVMSTADGGIKPVFALKKSVTQAPWKNALPSERVFMPPFEKALMDTMIDDLEGHAQKWGI